MQTDEYIHLLSKTILFIKTVCFLSTVAGSSYIACYQQPTAQSTVAAVSLLYLNHIRIYF